MSRRRYCVPQGQRDIHVGTEAIAVFFITPVLISVARTPGPLSGTQKGTLYLIAGATALFDGLLLSKWLRKQRRPRAVTRARMGG